MDLRRASIVDGRTRAEVKGIRIFISSPGDVSEERERARKVVEQLRRRYAGRLELQALLWEELPLQADMSFQQGIDLVLSGERDVDIAVFILWSRLGSPPGALIQRPGGGDYRSGTEREFDMMLTARSQSGGRRPQILVYTREDDASFDERLRGESLEKKQDLIQQKQLVESFIAEEFRDSESKANLRAYHHFDQPSTFSNRLRTHLQELLDEIAEVNPATPIWDIDRQGAPFRGLAVFQYEHAPVFFGREDEILEVRQALREQARDGRAFVLISGASGAGKSSLARGGVLPAVVEDEIDETVRGWRRCVFTPSQLASAGGDAMSGAKLFAGLARFLVAEGSLPELCPDAEGLDDLAAGLQRDPALTYRLRIKSALASAPGAENHIGRVRLIMLVDQFEELFTDARITAAEREDFAACLDAFARSGAIWVLATMRSDLYRELQRLERLIELKRGRGQIDLLPPGTDALRRLIEEPARLAGLVYEPREGYTLADRILRDAAAHVELLPLVEDLLCDLFQNRTSAGVMTFACYEMLGGVEGALARRAEAAFARQAPEVQATFHSMMKALVTVGGEVRDESFVRRHAPVSEVMANPNVRTLCEALVAERLLTSDDEHRDGSPGIPTISIAHEALLRVWERARLWVEQNCEFLRVRARIAVRMKEGSQLYESDPLLALAKSHVALDPEGFTAAQREYIQKCVEAIERKRRKKAVGRMAFVSGLIALGVLGALAANKASEESRKKEALLQQSALADLSVGRDLLASDRVRDALAYLVRSKPSGPASDLLTVISALHLNSWPFVRNSLSLHGHGNTVNCMEFSPDGSRIVSGSDDLSARIWDAVSGELLFCLWGHSAEIVTVHFDASGSRILTGSTDGKTCVWDAAGGYMLMSLDDNGDSVRSACFSPDGKLIATGSEDNLGRIWDAHTGERLFALEGHISSVIDCEFNPKGDRIVTASADKTARIWDAFSGKCVATCLGHEGFVRNAEFSPDGTKVVTSADSTARIWDSSSGKLLLSLSGHRAPISSAHFSPDGSRVVTASADKSARIWDSRSGKLLGILEGHDGDVFNARFSADGLRVATISSDRTTKLWDASSGELLTTFIGHEKAPKDVAFSPLGERIVTAAYDNDLHVWPSRPHRLTFVIRRQAEEITNAEPSADRGRILFVSGGRAEICDYASGSIRTTFHDPTASITCAAFSPDGSQVVAGTKKGVCVFNSSSGEALASFSIPNAPVRDAHLSADGKLIVASLSDYTARVCESSSGKQIAKFARHETAVYSAQFNKDASRVVTASADYTARIWDASSGNEQQVLHHLRPVWSAEFSPDGLQVVTASDDNTACVWDSNTGQRLFILNGHKSRVRSAHFSRDGKRIATTSLDGTAMIWDSSSGRLLGTLKGHLGTVYSARFDLDGSHIVSASADGTIRSWEIPDSGARAAPKWFSNFLTWLSFRKFNADGELTDLSTQESEQIASAIAPLATADGSRYGLIARWFLAPVGKRPIHPGSKDMQKEAADQCIQPDADAFQLQRAYDFDPTHPLIQIALARYEQDALRSAFLRQYGLQRLPADNPDLLRRAAELLAAQNQTALARDCVLRALNLHPDDSAALKIQAELSGR
jgi:WD40 repeat protein